MSSHALLQAHAERDDRLEIGPWQLNQELIFAYPGNQTFVLQAVSQDQPNLAQHNIAAGPAAHFINRLEVVDIEAQDCRSR
jgi:hypothetical protein